MRASVRVNTMSGIAQLDWDPQQWVNIPDIVIRSFENVFSNVNRFSEVAGLLEQSSSAFGERVGAKFEAFESRIMETQKELRVEQENGLNALKSSLDATSRDLRTLMRTEMQDLRARVDSVESSLQERMTQSMEALDKSFQERLRRHIKTFEEHQTKAAADVKGLSDRIDHLSADLSKLSSDLETHRSELDLFDSRLERKVDSVKAVLTGEVRTREEQLRKEMQNLHASVSNMSGSVSTLKGSFGDLFQKQREQELQDLQDMKLMFTTNLNKLSDVQREDLHKLKSEFQEADLKLHDAISRSIASSCSDLDKALRGFVQERAVALDQKMVGSFEALSTAQEEHESAVNRRFVSLRDELIRETKAREESVLTFDEKLVRLQASMVQDVHRMNSDIADIDRSVQDSKQELQTMVMERAQQLAADMQYMQKHLSRMLNEGSSSSFARISEARFFALETRLKEEENVRINETVRLDQEVSRLETSVTTPAAGTPMAASAVAHVPSSRRPVPPHLVLNAVSGGAGAASSGPSAASASQDGDQNISSASSNTPHRRRLNSATRRDVSADSNANSTNTNTSHNIILSPSNQSVTFPPLATAAEMRKPRSPPRDNHPSGNATNPQSTMNSSSRASLQSPRPFSISASVSKTNLGTPRPIV